MILKDIFHYLSVKAIIKAAKEKTGMAAQTFPIVSDEDQRRIAKEFAPSEELKKKVEIEAMRKTLMQKMYDDPRKFWEDMNRWRKGNE